jgi:hypothetical protein
VAPCIQTTAPELPRHQWFVEFHRPPENLPAIQLFLDEQMQQQNVYYRDLIQGNILQNLEIRPVAPGGFHTYMRSEGKLGGQNKVPRLADNRKIADALPILTA